MVRMKTDYDHEFNYAASAWAHTPRGARINEFISRTLADESKDWSGKWKQVKMGSPEEAEMLEKLNERMSYYQTDMMTFAARNKPWLVMTEAQRSQDLFAKNNMYQHNMKLMMMASLRDGLSFGSLCSAVGMYAGLCATNPTFRRDSQKTIGNLLQGAAGIISNLSGGKSKIADKVAELGRSYIMKANGGRIPYTPETIAIQDIALDLEAYDKMRDPELDSTEVYQNYIDAKGTLARLGEADGIDVETMMEHKSVLLGRLVQNDPSQAHKFEGIVNKGFRIGEPHTVQEVRMGPDGNPVMVDAEIWSGQWVDAHGEPVSFAKPQEFGARKPMRESQGALSLAYIYEDSMAQAFAKHDGNGRFDVKDIENEMELTNRISDALVKQTAQGESTLSAEEKSLLEENSEYSEPARMIMESAMYEDGMSDVQLTRMTAAGTSLGYGSSLSLALNDEFGPTGAYMSRYAMVMANELYRYDLEDPNVDVAIDELVNYFNGQIADPQDGDPEYMANRNATLHDSIKGFAKVAQFGVKGGNPPDELLPLMTLTQKAANARSLGEDSPEWESLDIFEGRMMQSLAQVQESRVLRDTFNLQYEKMSSFTVMSSGIMTDEHLKKNKPDFQGRWERAAAYFSQVQPDVEDNDYEVEMDF